MQLSVSRSLAALLCLTAIAARGQSPGAPDTSRIAGPAEVSVAVDLGKPLGAYKPIGSWFGYDEIDYTFGKNGQQLLGELGKMSRVPVTVRAHHLLTSGDGEGRLKWSSTNVFTLGPDGKPVYDYTVLDKIFDVYHRDGIRPFVELGFMPKDLATGTMPYEQPYPNTVKGSVQSPPKDYKLWGELVQHVVAHFVERYGRAEVATWYFEVWNEPDISYWQGTQAEYFKLYDYSVAGVRRALPGAIVGGPGSTGPGSERAQNFLRAFLEHCANGKSAATGGPIPLDFISFHPKGSPRLVDGHVRMGLSNELHSAENGFRIVAASGKWHNLPIVLSEADPEGCAACSAKENPANGYRNGTLYPTYTAAAMKALEDLAAENKVNLVGMITWAFEFEGRQYFEGFRTLATNGIDKPVLNVFRMAAFLNGERVAASSSGAVTADDIVQSGVRAEPDIDAFATKSAHDAAVMLWNYHDMDLPAPAAKVTVKISGIPAGVKRVRLEHFRIDETHSNAYTAWKAMGEPQQPTAEQLEQLKEAGQLQLLDSPEWLTVEGGAVTVTTELSRQATGLLHLEW
ncbi:MAG TPA: hypothetical protein VG714_03335 [Acidobacteriaceae bacterium]|nr:hypothetical protein [Acidobacteriaceae bacterium]